MIPREPAPAPAAAAASAPAAAHGRLPNGVSWPESAPPPAAAGVAASTALAKTPEETIEANDETMDKMIAEISEDLGMDEEDEGWELDPTNEFVASPAIDHLTNKLRFAFKMMNFRFKTLDFARNDDGFRKV